MGEAELSHGMHGTVSHMPPEAMKRPTSFTLVTDVYSFGVVLWEMYTQVGGMAWHGMMHDAWAYGIVQLARCVRRGGGGGAS